MVNCFKNFVKKLYDFYNQPDAPHCTTCTCATRVLHAVGAELPVGHQEEDRQVGLEQDHIRSHGRQLPPELDNNLGGKYKEEILKRLDKMVDPPPLEASQKKRGSRRV